MSKEVIKNTKEKKKDVKKKNTKETLKEKENIKEKKVEKDEKTTNSKNTKKEATKTTASKKAATKSKKTNSETKTKSKASSSSKNKKKSVDKKKAKKTDTKTKASKDEKKSESKIASKSKDKSLDKKEKEKENKKELEKLKKMYDELFPEKEDIEYLPEYYDLPYKYDKNIVRVLAQTPKKLCVFWDINNEAIKALTDKYTQDFWDKTYPVLLVKNEKHQFSFEIPINDFANTWYIDIPDDSAYYSIELGRKFKETLKVENKEFDENYHFEKDHIYLFTRSNYLESPNGHILFDTIKKNTLFKNIKTNEEFYIKTDSVITNNIIKIYEEHVDISDEDGRLHALSHGLSSSYMSSMGGSNSNFDKN